MKKKLAQEYNDVVAIADPELIGLHDPDAPTRMNTVKRPIESF